MSDHDEANRCWSCEEALPRGARFCMICGAPQDDPAERQSPSLRNLRALGHGPTAVAATPTAVALPTRYIPANTRLGIYIVDEVIGEGGMGVVYLGRDTVQQREVAIKVLHANLVGDPGIRRRFAREARLMMGRPHPNVVKVFDTIDEEELVAIVMEFVEGPSLQAYIDQWGGQLPYEEVRLVFEGVLAAMEAAHAAGVVHRDLKPDNILLRIDEDGLVPKVVDFGVAKALEGTQFTVTGAVMGTFRYMSPEQVESPGNIDHRTDIYALGVTLYQACTGRCPFEAPNNFALMMAHARQEPPPPSLYRANMPPLLDRLIRDALSKDPKARPPTCAEFRQRLAAALSGVAPERPKRKIELPKRIVEADGGELLLVPAGSFQMGTDRRTVYLDAFYMARHPVTNRQFARFLEATNYQPSQDDDHRFLAHWDRGRRVPRALLDHPVVFISWHDACAYCSWAGKRLPTEAEWEKAARGTDGRKYPWGRTTPTAAHANFGRTSGGTVPVDAHPESGSPYGVHDMAGNVWEWCEDVDDPRFYLRGPDRNPRNTVQPGDAPHVARGGSWMYDASSLRTIARNSFKGHFRLDGLGFRCAMS